MIELAAAGVDCAIMFGDPMDVTMKNPAVSVRRFSFSLLPMDEHEDAADRNRAAQFARQARFEHGETPRPPSGRSR
jgi:hypothetical protein